MSYLIDTNVITELVRRQPSDNVIGWFDRVTSERLHVSVLTLGELRKGVEALPADGRRERMSAWIEIPHFALACWSTRIVTGRSSCSSCSLGTRNSAA